VRVARERRRRRDLGLEEEEGEIPEGGRSVRIAREGRGGRVVVTLTRGAGG
jgi:hypothetical protein